MLGEGPATGDPGGGGTGDGVLGGFGPDCLLSVALKVICKGLWVLIYSPPV